MNHSETMFTSALVSRKDAKEHGRRNVTSGDIGNQYEKYEHRCYEDTAVE